ncbi:MAG: DUF4262 domain-containing protein [Gammaproteobacteria bacterium]
MELSQFHNGIAMHNEVIRQAIKNDALYVMHEDGYSYTVGMRDIGAPELIIYGQRDAVATEMFKIIYTAAAQKFDDLDMNRMVKTVFNPAPELSVVSEREKKTIFFAVRTYYDDWVFTAIKIIMKSNKRNC